jgi:8-oxo-dGTP pyrophosphatase MutT (NUDIX family)
MWTTLTGCGALVVQDGRLLLVRQRRSYGTHWEFPSGYYEPGESFEQTAAREVLEEAGIEVEIDEFVCSMVWERKHDRRRNVLAFFSASPIDPRPQPRPQVEEEIDAAAFRDPAELPGGEIHPLDQVILDRWWKARQNGFHIHADVTVNPDGTQSYAFS